VPLRIPTTIQLPPARTSVPGTVATRIRLSCPPGIGLARIFGPRAEARSLVDPREVLTVASKSGGKKDACYFKVKSRYSVWPSAYASGALVKCRKVGAKNWGNKSKRKK